MGARLLWRRPFCPSYWHWACSLVLLPSVTPHSYPLVPNGEETNEPMGLRDPFPSCLTTPTLEPAPGAPSGPCVPHPALAQGGHCLLPCSSWPTEPASWDQWLRGVPSWHRPSLCTPPLQPPSSPQTLGHLPYHPPHLFLSCVPTSPPPFICHSPLTAPHPGLAPWDFLLPAQEAGGRGAHFQSLFSTMRTG